MNARSRSTSIEGLLELKARDSKDAIRSVQLLIVEGIWAIDFGPLARERECPVAYAFY